jgi:DNA-binding winged helix-turn-helix (wHTH) protein/tetratricopeptide (TPR) repeat protein
VRVKIQDQPFRVLILLLERPGEILTREELRQKLWPEGTFVDFDGSLNVIFKKLRAALDDDSDNPRFIETVPRRGYRFIAPVSESGTSGEPTPAVAPIPPGTQNDAGIIAEGHSTRKRAFHLIYMSSAVMLLLAIGLGWLGWHRGRGKTPALSSQITAPIPVRESIAVLGFRSVTGRGDDAWLAPAFSEMLSTELAGSEKLRLVSGEEVANLRLSSPWSQTDTLDQQSTARIGTALNSDFLVLGSYTTVGRPDRRQLRVDVRLQQARTGEILAEIADIGDTQDLFHIISRVGGKLRDRLGIPRLDEPEEASVLAALPSDREAARFYALGLAKLRQFDFLAAKDMLEQSSKADPKFSLGHAMLAQAWSRLGYEQKRKQEAKKALDLSAALPRAYRMLVEGNYYESLADHENAASVYHALFVLFPDSVEYGLQLASAQAAAGHGSQALETLAQLRRLPPPSSGDPLIDLAEARITSNVPSQLTLIRNATAKAESQGRKLVYAQARREECLALMYSDHPEPATAACADAYEIFLAAGNRLGAADAMRLLGDRHGEQGHLEQAIATYQRALAILQELGEHEKTGAVLNNMGINFQKEGQLDRAEQMYQQAKHHFEQAGDKNNVGVALENIADVLYLRGNLSSAGKVYAQTLEIESSLDPSDPGYPLYRLADLALAQGQVQEAHRRADQAISAYRLQQGSYQYLTSVMVVLGDVLVAEGDLPGARRQYQEALEMRQKLGEMDLIAESQVSLAKLSLDEGHPEQGEPLVRSAIAEFEKEKSTPDEVGAYVVLSRVLLMQGKLDDARNAVQRASELGRTSSDPALKLPAAIQDARVEMATAAHASQKSSALAGPRLKLRTAAASAKKLGYYQLECEARLALSELELKLNPVSARTQLLTLAAETRSRGFELLARRAEQAASSAGSMVAERKPSQ